MIIKLMSFLIFSFYGLFIFLNLIFCIERFINIDQLLKLNFWLKLFLSWFVFLIDYFYFLRSFIIWFFWIIYQLYYDIKIGSILTSSYTDTDLNKVPDFYDNDGTEEKETIPEKDFDLVHFEFVYFYLRILSILRFFYLIYYISINIIKFFLRKMLFQSLRNVFFFWFLYFIGLNIFLFIKTFVFEDLVKNSWEFLLRVRTYSFIIIHQEYFYVWFYSFFNSVWWFDAWFTPRRIHNEKEPSSQYYSFFLNFYGYLFLNKKDEFLNFKFYSLKKIFFLSIYFLIDIFFKIFFYILKIFFNNIKILKIEYKIKVVSYNFILKLEFFSFKTALSFFWIFFIKFLKMQYLIVFFFKPFIFIWNYFFKYFFFFLGFLLNYLLIFINVIVLNLILIFVKLFPLLINRLFFFKGFFFLIVIFYYIDFEFLSFILNNCLDAFYKFYYVKYEHHYYIARNFLRNFPISNQYGVIPDEFWDEFPLLSVTPLQFHNKLRPFPRSFLWKGKYFVMDINLYLSLRDEELKWGYWFKIKYYNLKFWAYFRKNIWSFKVWTHQFWNLVKIYKFLFISYHHAILSYEILYIYMKISFCWKYLVSVILVNLSFIPFYWYYFFLQKKLNVTLFFFFNYFLNLFFLCIYYSFNYILFLWQDYIYYFFMLCNDFFIFYLKWLYSTYFKIIYKIEYYCIIIINWLKSQSQFLKLFFNSLYMQTLHWYLYIIFFDLANIEIYKKILFFFIDFYKVNNYYNFSFGISFEFANLVNILYIKYVFLKSEFNLKHYFFLKNFHYSYDFFCNMFYFLWESTDRFIDILSLNYDQFRIYYHNRIDIDETLFFGEVSKKTKKEAGIRKRWISNKNRKSSISNFGSFESLSLTSFSFILADLFSLNYKQLEKFVSRQLIYSEYVGHYNMFFAFEYFFVIFVIFYIGRFFFPKLFIFLGDTATHLNAEYCWRQFRKTKGEDLTWLFDDINKYVRGYFMNRKFRGAEDFRKEYEEDPEFFNYMDSLIKAYDQKTNLNAWSKFEEMSANPYLWRAYWLNKFMEQFRAHELENLNNPPLNFSSYYFDDEFESYYKNYISNYAFFHALLLYGIKRNKNLELADLSEGNFEIIPQFYNKLYKKRWLASNNLKEYFFTLDEQIYYGLLPWWSYHKDLFSHQLLDTNIIIKEADKTSQEDEKYFFIEAPSMWLSSFIAYWVFFLPIFLCIKFTFIWPRHYLIMKQELEFYFYGFLGRFSIFNNFFDILASPYWADIQGERKKASGQAQYRRKYKRRFRHRLRYLMDVTGWGPYCWWNARHNKIFFIIKGFYVVYMYLKYIFLYFFIVLAWIIFYYFCFAYNNNFLNIKNFREFSFKEYKAFWKFKLYLQSKNFNKLNYFKKW